MRLSAPPRALSVKPGGRHARAGRGSDEQDILLAVPATAPMVPLRLLKGLPFLHLGKSATVTGLSRLTNLRPFRQAYRLARA